MVNDGVDAPSTSDGVDFSHLAFSHQEMRTVHNELRDGTQRLLDRIGQPGPLSQHVHDAVGTLVQGLKRATGLARKRQVEEHRHESNRQRPSNQDQYQRLALTRDATTELIDQIWETYSKTDEETAARGVPRGVYKVPCTKYGS